jgi:chemotaxis signal transduction protein
MQLSKSGSSCSQSTAASATGDLQILQLKLGTHSFGVPLTHVSYVAQMPSGFASRGAEVGHHFVFEGSPLHYVSLWDRLGHKSGYAEYEEMQAMLPQRRQDHLDWMSALENSIRTGTPFAKARNAHECAFGKWFYNYRTKDRRLSMLLAQFEQPHATIHALADRLLGMSGAGHGEDALHAFEEAKNSTLAMLMKLFESAQELVVELQRRIAVIVSDGENTCALGADSVHNIVTVPPERVKENAGKAAGIESQATSALIILDNHEVVPLLNWRKFCNSVTV